MLMRNKFPKLTYESMSKKQFIKKITVAVCMTVFIVSIASLTYAYVVPALLAADIPGMISSVEEKTEGISAVFANTTNELEKVHNDTQISEPADTPNDIASTNIAKQQIPDVIPYGTVKSGKVTKIVDGDTIDIDGIRIRLSLVNTPERNEQGYSNATAFTIKQCPVGTRGTL